MLTYLTFPMKIPFPNIRIPYQEYVNMCIVGCVLQFFRILGFSGTSF